MGILFGLGAAAVFMCGVGFVMGRILKHATFKAHQEIEFIHADGQDYSCCDKECVRINFKDWKSIYLGDPEHWKCVRGRSKDGDLPVAIPVYINGDTVKPVKFLTAGSYYKWQHFVDKENSTGQDYQNHRNKLELLDIIKQANERNIAEQQALLQKARQELGGV